MQLADLAPLPVESRPWDAFWNATARDVLRLGAAGALAARQGFVLSPAQARAAGVDAAELRRHLRAGRWWQPRRGVLSPVQFGPPPTIREPREHTRGGCTR